jgi:hypothetical protein
MLSSNKNIKSEIKVYAIMKVIEDFHKVVTSITDVKNSLKGNNFT